MKAKRIIAGIAVVTGLYLTFGFRSQDDDPIKKILAQLTKWTADSPVEKVYLHLDKPNYAVGDDIWFKAYVTVGGLHQLSAMSNILNVELLNDKDSVQQALKLPVIGGIAFGDFALADSLREGNYRIRAYTNYMRNAGEGYFFDKTLLIGNAVNNTVFTRTNYRFASQNGQQQVTATVNYTDLSGKPYALKEVSYDVQLDFRSVQKGRGTTDANGNINISFNNTMPMLLKSGRIVSSIKVADKRSVVKIIPVKATSNNVSVQFFPESGTLVAGVRSKVAFKAVGADGLGVAVSGTVKDNANNDVVKFSTQHLGMGVFSFSPEAGKTYSATVTNPDGSQNNIALPPVAESGYVLAVSNNPESIFVRILPSASILSSGRSTELSLVAHAGGVVCYAAKSAVTATSFSANIPKSRFPSGIVQFTLFSATGEPLNERVVFVQNDDLLKLNVSSARQTYAPRQKVKIDVTVKDKDDKPVVGSFSAAVIDETRVPLNENTESTILSNLLLTSDIKGYVEEPNYYFANTNDKTRSDLDLLMLTQGYRRFEWKQILNDVFPAPAFAAEKSLSISGTIKTPGGKPVANGKVTLFSTAGGMFVLDTVSDSKGKFSFTNLIFRDSIRFVVQARTEKNKKDVEIELDNVSVPVVSRNKNAADIQVSITDVLSDYLKTSNNKFKEELKYGLGNHATMLKEVTVSEKKKPIQNSSNLNGAGQADQVIKADQLQSCATLSQCLQMRANFVLFRNGVAYSTRSPNNPMQIIVDGMPMEPDYLDQISPTDVETVEVLRTIGTTAIYGSQGGGGVLVITTKRGGSTESYARYAPGVVTYAPKGYYKAREFYAPKYDDPKTNTQMADLRTTIFWKPNMVTDKAGNTSFEFFNADGKGSYRIVVEGIDADGNIGRQVYRYRVE